jgi:hypothetical protein
LPPTTALAVWLLCCSCCCLVRSGSGSDPVGQCPARPYRPPDLSLRDRGGLSALVGSAEETRALVVRGDLPYDFIGTRAREA